MTGVVQPILCPTIVPKIRSSSNRFAAACNRYPSASLAGRRFIEPRRVDAEQPDEVGAGALEEFEEVGVIDDAGAIGVLEIDAHRKDMGLALDAAGNVGPPPGHARVMGARTVIRPRCR